MRDNQVRTIPKGHGEDSPYDSLHALSSSYTPRQREKILKGLRILARVVIRSHMVEQAGSLTESDEEEGAED